MSASCSFEGCSYDETGLCALSNEPSICSKRLKNQSDNEQSSSLPTASNALEGLGSPVLEQPESTSFLGPSRSLGMKEMNSMMSSRYVNVVGILGDPESGKTACLASLYLLVSHAKLDGWSFADSRSLSAFEDIARGARDWNDAVIPEQMTVHTELKDHSTLGFLHLKLVRKSDGRRIDFALPDIPGEWTQALVTSARAERLEFMRSAEAIWIVLDGRLLADLEKRQGLIVRVGQLVARLKTMFEERVPRLILVVTHRDTHELNDISRRLLLKEVTRRGTIADIVCVAPFSNDQDTIPAGFGLSDLINTTVGESANSPPFWQTTEPVDEQRMFLSYRRY